MTERRAASPSLRLLGGFFVSACLALPGQALAQGSDEAEQKEPEEIIVTGSRIKRDTFSSVAPLQIISNQGSREIGQIDPSSILQDSSAAGIHPRPEAR